MLISAAQALEFDRVREALAAGAATALGRARALALEPAVEPDEIARRLDLTVEAVRFAKDGRSLAITAPEDLQVTLQVVELGDQPLDPAGLLGLAQFVESVHSVSASVSASYSRLFAIAQRPASFDGEIAAIRRAIHPSGDVNDDASPALRDIRDKLRRARAKLRSTLEGLVRGRDTAKYLQDEIITDRNGRYVVVVRAEFREAIPGLVHASSASGASLYVEPLSTVEANNDIVALAEREVQEVRRILLALTNAFRVRAGDLEVLLDVAADLDELYARARFAARLDGTAPALATDGRVEFRGARHPLLVIRSAKGPRRSFPGANVEEMTSEVFSLVVGTDILVVPPTTALVISGPNTGGKTVALKAAGLLAIMAQAGLLIPVDPGSAFTPFRSIFADIGDEQSIAASLSTFSGHIANLVDMDRALELPALMLLDEVGGGTDPIEGGALGVSVIDHFRLRGAIVVATTHDDAIKSYAATTPGVMTAAFGFNPETYAPTYRLVYGAPGRSLALEIAERLGMPHSVIAAARARRSERESLLAAHLARIDQELAALEGQRAGVAGERDRLAAEQQRLIERETRVTEREAVLKRRLDDRLNDKLREARNEVDQIVGKLKQKADTLKAAPLSTGDIGHLRVEGRAALEAVEASLGLAAPQKEEGHLDEAPAVGQVVFVSTFGADGIVRGVAGKDVDVEIKGKRVRVAIGALRRPATRGSSSNVEVRTSKFGQSGERSGTASPTPAAARELVVIGQTVDQAVDRAEKFLDDALLSDERRLRIVHGHGTGRLRDGLRAFFREHPLVLSVTPAADNEGGGAATIIELKD
jgi:DNA mismatch repair protein MutS2